MNKRIKINTNARACDRGGRKNRNFPRTLERWKRKCHHYYNGNNHTNTMQAKDSFFFDIACDVVVIMAFDDGSARIAGAIYSLQCYLLLVLNVKCGRRSYNQYSVTFFLLFPLTRSQPPSLYLNISLCVILIVCLFSNPGLEVSVPGGQRIMMAMSVNRNQWPITAKAFGLRSC